MSIFKEFQTYIADLCMRHHLVQHGKGGRKSFFRMDGEEVLAAIPNNAASPYVVVAGFAGWPGDDEGLKLQQTAILLFLSKSKAMAGNRAGETERAQEEAMDVMFDFIARMQADYETSGGCGFMDKVDLSKMQYESVGPMNQLGYGWQLTIFFRTNMPGYDEDKWDE